MARECTRHVDALRRGRPVQADSVRPRSWPRRHDVLICEEHAAIGSPVHCTGVLAAESFRDFDLPCDATLKLAHHGRASSRPPV